MLESPAEARVSPYEVMALLGAALLLLLPVWMLGAPSGHDVTIHLHWIEAFRRSLGEGCWYPRWLAGVNNGGGSPTFVFYFPALAYAASFVRVFASDLIDAVWIVSAVALLASGVAMTAFLHGHCRRGALLGGLVYMAGPYRLLDLYERGAFPEAMAFLWPPVILLAIDRYAASESTRWLAAIAIATGGLTFTHHGMLVLFLPLLGAYALLGPPLRIGLGASAALLLGLGLGAVSLLPAIAERQYVHWMEPQFRYFFLFHPGPTYVPEFADRLDRDALAAAVSAAFGIAVAWKVRTRVALLFGAAGAVAFFLACEPSVFVWDALPPLQQIDLPWRWLAVCSLTGAVTVALALDRGTPLRVLGIACALLSVASGVQNWMLPARHSPSLRSQTLSDPSWPDLPIFVPRGAHLTEGPARGPVFSGRSIALEREVSTSMEYQTVADRESRLEIDTFYYPGWVATVDGEPVDIRPTLASGRITIRVPKGTHRVAFAFTDTPDRIWAARLSVLSGAAIAALLLAGGRSGRS